ncbi:SCO7613 C-terminal domain-containing membrane protein [Promicromonospora sp. NPDC057138]|uniref:SCO7613 C-terminal domain-containing membrane protein n=1 Tax=Promicromonospora sp. NPDC057138 TaxID=3346031 RepID=UPI00362B1E2A
MEETWVRHALKRLPDTRACPGCGTILRGGVCGHCALDLRGQSGIDLHGASLAAERAIRDRQRILDEMRAEQPAAARFARIADGGRASSAAVGVSTGSTSGAGASLVEPVETRVSTGSTPDATVETQVRTSSTRDAASGSPAGPRSAVALQPILAGVGAALLAVSAVVFVFFTLADQLVLRTIATLLVTVASVVAAALMRRAGLRSSAEAVAALAVALAWVCAELGLQAGLLGGVDDFVARAVLLALLAPSLVALGGRLKVRSWAAAGAVSAPLVPLLLAAGLSDVVLPARAWILALVAAALVAHAGTGVLRRVGERLGLTPRWETGVLRAARTVAVPAALVATALSGFAPLPFAAWWALVSVGAAALGHALRVRAWATTGLVMAPFAAFPAALALPDDVVARPWAVGAGALLVALATLGGPAVARATGPRVGSALRVELRLLEVAQALAVVVAVGAALLVPPVAALAGLPGDGETAVLLAATAVVVAVLRRGTHRRWWTFTAGALGAVAALFLAARDGADLLWVLPAAAGLAWLTLAAVLTALVAARARRFVPAARTRADLLLAAWLVAVLAAVPALWAALPRGFEVLFVALELAPTPGLGAGPLGSGSLGAGSADGGFMMAEVRDPSLLGLVVLALLMLAASRLGGAAGTTADRTAPVVRIARAVGPWVTVVLALAAALHPRLQAATSLALLAGLAALLLAATADPERSWRGLRPVVTGVRSGFDGARRATAVLARLGGSPMGPGERPFWRAAALTGTWVALSLLTLGSWQSRPTVLAAAAVVVPLVLAARAALPRPAHAALVGGAYAYALVVGGVWLGWLGLDWVAAVCSVSAAASLTAAAVTVGTKVTRGEWFAVLGVTAVPFALGVLTVVTERTWWSAGAAAAMLLLELVLLLTRRAGLSPVVRVIAAGLVLPTAAVATVSAGAMVLPISGSPVLLPVIAAAVAVAAGGAPRVAGFLTGRLPDGGVVGRWVRGTLELSAVVTGAITVGLAYGRPSAGPDIAVAVLLLLAVGAGVVAREPDRTRVWWLAGGLATAAVWTALADGGVRLVEAYTLPPAVAAILVGTLLARRAALVAGGGGGTGAAGTSGGTDAPASGRRSRGWRLVAAGTVLALVPSVLTLALASGPGNARAWTLLVVGIVATLAIVGLRRWPLVSAGWAAHARTLLAGAALLASAGLAVESLQVAGHAAGSPGARFAIGLGWACAAGALSFVAVTGARPGAPSARLGRAIDLAGHAPALLFLVVGAVANAEPSWGAIVTLWVLEVALLVLLVLVARRLLRGLTTGIPSWAVWLGALAAAIAAWSPRDLRVEVFSVPLGVGLVVAGCFALGEWEAHTKVSGPGSARPPQRTLVGWPVGWTGSWALLGPGILALLGPSVLATFTDPQTWRAVLVVGVALAAVLVGSRRGLASPFLLGVWVLPVEVLVVFLTQLGTEISAVPWMLTLAAAGGVLLIIATLDERRTAGYGGAAAYLRDLR